MKSLLGGVGAKLAISKGIVKRSFFVKTGAPGFRPAYVVGT